MELHPYLFQEFIYLVIAITGKSQHNNMLMLQTIFPIVLHAALQTFIPLFIPKMNLPTYFLYLGN